MSLYFQMVIKRSLQKYGVEIESGLLTFNVVLLMSGESVLGDSEKICSSSPIDRRRKRIF